MRIAYLLGYSLGFAVQTIAGRPTQNDRLRAENRSLRFENVRLSRIADELAATLYEKAVDEERAEQMVAHPAASLPAADITWLDSYAWPVHFLAGVTALDIPAREVTQTEPIFEAALAAHLATGGSPIEGPVIVCPTCQALSGHECRTSSGRKARWHAGRRSA